MSNNFQLSEEDINEIILNSPFSLPDSPAERGLKAIHIKKYFYVFLRILAKKLNVSLEKIATCLSETDALLEKITEAGGMLETQVEGHNQNEQSHPYLVSEINEIVSKIEDLEKKDTELGTLLEAKISEHSKSTGAHNDIRSLIGARVNAHDQTATAHKDIRALIDELSELARVAYKLSSGKSTVYPVESFSEVSSYLTRNAGYEVRVGDIFLFKSGNVSDLTVFSTDRAEVLEGEIEITASDIIFGTVELEPGKTYVYDSFALVASKSGLETELLAKAEDLTYLSDLLDAHISAYEEDCLELEGILEKKEPLKNIVLSAENDVLLTHHTEFNLGTRTSIAFLLPSELDYTYESIVCFHSATTPTSIDAPSELFFVGDDCENGVLSPISNRLYEINIKHVLDTLIARVSSIDYEVII